MRAGGEVGGGGYGDSFTDLKVGESRRGEEDGEGEELGERFGDRFGERLGERLGEPARPRPEEMKA